MRFEALQRLVSDWHYSCPVDHVTDTLSQASDIFKYRFSVKNPYDMWPQWSGVNHGDELDYVFGRPLASEDMFGERDKELSRFMIEAWTNFAKYG